MSAQLKYRSQPPPPPPPKRPSAPLRVALGDGELTTLKRDPNAKVKKATPPPPPPGRLRRAKLGSTPREVVMPRPKSMGDTKVRSLPVAPTRRDDSRVEAAPNSEPVQVAKPVSKPATVAPGLTSPIRVGPKPARPTSVPSFPDPLAPRRRSAADFVSSEPLPTLPNLEGLSRKKARIGRKRWLMIGAAALSFAIVGAVAATLLFPSESSQAPSTVAATEAEPVPEPQPAAEHSTSEATAEAAAVAPAPVEPAPVEPAAPAVDTPPASADEAAEAEGTAPAPEPAPVPATLEVEDPQIARARRALEDERPGSAYQVASAAFAERPSKAALLLMVESSCHLGSETRARDAYTKIPLSARPQIRAVCLELGIELGA